VDDVVLVTQDEICAAIKDGFEATRTLLEPAGALAIAGLKRYVEQHGPLGPAIAIASGANISISRLGYVAERAEVGEHREALFAVGIPERPGSFLTFCGLLGERSVTEFNYRLSSRHEAHVFVGLEVDGLHEAERILGDLRAAGYEASDLTQD